MPYIPKPQRHGLDRFEYPQVEQRKPVTAGELAYTVTVECVEFLRAQPGRSFTAFAMMVGVLICVTLELYRRIIARHEDLAIVRNGDIEGMIE